MKIAILGTRGIPNYHGGFEQFAEFFSVFLQQKGIEIYVYCSSKHPYNESTFNGVRRIICNDPEGTIGTAGQFIYDLNCILDARKRNFDVILQLGYTSNSIWYFLLPKKPVIITNMDGLEWKRTKYSKAVQKFLKVAEKLAVKHSDYLIADSVGIQDYLKQTFGKHSAFIAYGATVFEEIDETRLASAGFERYSYDMLIARMEPENNIEVIIKGYLRQPAGRKLLIIGSYHTTSFGQYLYRIYAKYPQLVFLGAVYDMNLLNNLRYFSNLYFHGHSVGGTNPSLLEAMASNCCIVAHKNIFNQSILGEDAFYFEDEIQLSELLSLDKLRDDIQQKIKNNTNKIIQQYSWDLINESYLAFIQQCLEKKK